MGKSDREEPALTFLLDVDNTLLDNDRAKRVLDAELAGLVGRDEAVRFWETYEAVRRQEGMVNIPLTLAKFERVEREPSVERARLSRQRRFALADLWMGFAYAPFLYPSALDVLAYLRRLGRVAILSDGDPTFQPSKIWRAGLDEAVDGAVLVFDHKERHLGEVVAAFPADRYVLIDDKPGLLVAAGAQLADTMATVFVRQGKYALADVAPGPHPTLTVDRIADLLDLTRADFLAGFAGLDE